MRIIAEGARFDVVEAGQGPALVLLHGFPLAKETWDEPAALLAQGARVVRFDLRGLGSTTVTPGPYLMETLAGDVVEVLDALGIERAVVAGHSLGGYVALAFYRMFAERCAGLGIVASRLSADSPEQAAWRLDLAERAEREGMAPVADAFIPKYFAPEVYRDQPALIDAVTQVVLRTDPRGAAAMLRGMAARVDSHDLAAEMTLPVALIAGRTDAFIPVAELQATSSQLPDATFEVLECGHTPPYEAPAALAHSLARLVARTAVLAS